MSAAQRMPVLAGTLSAGALLAAVSAIPSLRNTLGRYMNIALPAHFWKYVAVLFALLNLKCLPFAWHYRVFRGILYHLYLSPHPITRPHLFKPLITYSYNAPIECDYNLHKSNSTYFSDLDVSRAHYVGCLLRTGLRRLNRGDTAGLPADVVNAKQGSYIIALGGVACVFRKEIAPFERFEIWTRLLSWDNKWLYIVSHVVRRGRKKPRSWALQPWKRSRKQESVDATDENHRDWKKDVFASSIAKYVVKKGRLTIKPEIVLERSNLLPQRSDAAQTSAGVGEDTNVETSSTLTSPESAAVEVGAKLGLGGASGPANKDSNSDEEMSWEEVEAKRRHGLDIAQHFDGLTGLHDEFGSDDQVLGSYSDLC